MTRVAERVETTTSKEKKLAGKVALVTGGSRGIGASIAKELAGQGATIAITYANNKAAADEVVAEIAKLGVGAVAHKANSGSAEESQKAIDAIIKSLGKIDILVNNAGVFDPGHIEQIDIKHYDKIFDTNVKGVVATTIAAIPHIAEGGRIINVSSVAADVGLAGFSVYSASKAALNALTRVWAQDLGARKITVNGVAPGPVETDMFKQVADEAREGMVAKTALSRVGQPKDIASVVAFLASEDGGWITGQTIRTDGGINI